jgi:hypothetical protein
LQNYNNRDFIEKLSQANCGAGSWDSGWKVYKLEEPGRLSVRKDNLTLWIPNEQFIPVDGIIEIGKEGFIPMVKEFRRLLPGFYAANSNEPFDPHGTVVRIYWNVSAPKNLVIRNFIINKAVMVLRSVIKP